MVCDLILGVDSMAAKLISVRPSSRNPDVQYRMFQMEDGRITCDCPACFHGGICYPRQEVKARQEYHKLLSIKAELSEIKLKTKAELISEQWDYHFAMKIRRHF